MKCLVSRLVPALLGAILAAPAFAHTLQGRVLEPASLAPVAWATIYVDVVDPDSIRYVAYADEAGNFVVPGIVPDNSIYVATCYRLGYQESYTRIDRLATEDVTIDLVLGPPLPPPPPPGPAPDSGSVSGRVMAPGSAGTLRPIEKATVTLRSTAGTTVAVTDTQGDYRTKVGLGTYSIGVSAAGYDAVDPIDVPVGAGGIRFDVVLNPAGTSGVSGPGVARVWLGPVAPNPVSAGSTLFYSLPVPGHVDLALYDAAGRRARTLVSGWENAGPHAVPWSAQDLPSGAYFVHVRVGHTIASKTLVIVR